MHESNEMSQKLGLVIFKSTSSGDKTIFFEIRNLPFLSRILIFFQNPGQKNQHFYQKIPKFKIYYAKVANRSC
jgi:hypothetical protein